MRIDVTHGKGSAPMKYKAVAVTDQGPYRKTNQDSVLIREKYIRGNKIVLAVLCDGMGGLEYGEIASRMAVDSFEKWFDDFLTQAAELPSKEKMIHDWKRLIADINIEIYNYAASVSTQIGTTLTAMILFENHYVIGHVGDSRIYLINKDKISQLTEDHSLVAQEVRKGVLSSAQAKTDKRRHLLVKSVGVKSVVDPQFISGEINKFDAYLLCSDGLWNKVEENEMQQEILADNCAVEHLIQSARSKNEKDNISVITVIEEKKMSFGLAAIAVVIAVIITWIIFT